MIGRRWKNCVRERDKVEKVALSRFKWNDKYSFILFSTISMISFPYEFKHSFKINLFAH